MWVRLIGAPWWVRWIVLSAVIAVFTGVIWTFLGPNIASAFGWPWRVAVLVGFSVVVAAPILVIQQPSQRAYAAAFGGLTRRQRSQAATALRRGEVPSDPEVLAAAIRVGSLTAAYRATASSAQKAIPWLLPPLYVVLAVEALFTHDVRRAVMWLVFALVFAGLAGWTRYKTRRLMHRLALLRSAADAQGLPTEFESSVPPPKPRAWHRVAAVVVLIVATTAFAFAMGRPRADCRTVDRVVAFIYDHSDMLDAQLIPPGGPGLGDYQSWSDQLDRYSAQVSASDLAPHLHRIADLSTQAVALVRDVRGHPAAVSAETVQRQFAYQDVIKQMISEDTAANDVCHPR